jgi:diaminopimelate decarboxylase
MKTHNKKTAAVHANMDAFSMKDNELQVNKVKISHIEKLLGSTPFYAYDKKLLQDKVAKFKSVFPKEITLHYAIKANPFPALVHFMSSQVDGFDVASKKEMLLALQTGMTTDEISFAGPGKSKDDIQATIIAGVTLHVESKTELDRAISIGEQLRIKPKIALRVNPAFELKASGMKMSGGAKPFGIDEELLADLLKNIPYDKLIFRGFHIFAGSQNLKIESLIEMHQKVFQLAEELINLTPVKIDYVNIGGGLGIPYFPGEKHLDLQPISQNLQTLINQYKTSFNGIKLVMELGRFLVGEAGIYVTKVLDKKESRQTTYLVCDGGLHHHLANSGNFGQVIRKNYPVVIGNKVVAQEASTIEKETVTIVGPLCTPLDIIADKVTLPEAQIDDYVVVYQSGAYGASASPKDFLSQPEVFEILL